jgi:hypothetical protein
MDTCLNCGNELRTGKKYCSYQCYWEWMRKNSTFEIVIQTCQFCGKEFQFPKYRVGLGYGKYCSIECKNKGIKHPRKERTEKICRRCGKAFYVLPSQLKRENGAGTYCSWECYCPPTIKKCLECGKEFRAYLSSGQKYCSKFCADTSPIRNEKIGAAQRALQSDPKFRKKFLEWVEKRTASKKWKSSAHFQKDAAHPAYRGNATARENEKGQYQYKKWRKDVFMRDFYTCQKCGVKGTRFHAHHIKHWADCPKLRYDIDNGITLCISCHRAEHAK